MVGFGFLGKAWRHEDNEHDNDEEGKEVLPEPVKRPSRFPCCFYIPLDIAMQGFALFDILYYGFFAFLWTIIQALEPFRGRDPRIRRNSTNYLEYYDAIRDLVQEEELYNYDQNAHFSYEDRFEETSTESGPTLFNPADFDFEKMARVYSKIAYKYHHMEQEVDENCGRNYYQEYLFTDQLDRTRTLFDEMCVQIIAAHSVHMMLGIFCMVAICCFRGYIFSKIFIMLLWYAQLVPTYLILNAAVMSQSYRLCILQYGVSKTIRGQNLIFWWLLWPLVSYKPYEFFIWAMYVRKYFQNKEGEIHDESIFTPIRVKERQRRKSRYHLSHPEFSRTKRGDLFRQGPMRQEGGSFVGTTGHSAKNDGVKARAHSWRNSSSSD